MRWGLGQLGVGLVVVCCACSSSDDNSANHIASGGNPAAGGNTSVAGSGSRCEQGCVATLAADCDNGPPTQQQCVADCEMLEAGPCGTEYAALQACAEGETITCNGMGIPVIEACSNEQTAFVSCLN
jgi:hypothetical protein